jgi:DNA modification methylase
MIEQFENKIINADCLDILKQLPDKCIDLVLTDPPYILTPHGGGRKGLADRSSKIRDEIEFIANDFDFESVSDELLRVCKIPNIIMFCSAMQLGRTIVYFENKGYRVDVLVWSKSNPAPLSNGKYISDIEYIVYVHTKGSTWNNKAPNDYKKKTKIHPIITNKMGKIHPTQKPTDLIKELVCVHSMEGDLVLDCFSGSGVLAVVCNSLKRRFVCIEKDKCFYEASKNRLEEHQKQLTLF